MAQLSTGALACCSFRGGLSPSLVTSASLGEVSKKSWQQEWAPGSLRVVKLERRVGLPGLRRRLSANGKGAEKQSTGGRRKQVGVAHAFTDFNLADKEKFEGMVYRRVVYDFADWKKHRSSRRFLGSVRSMLQSRVVWALGPVVSRLVLWAAIVVLYNSLVLAKAWAFLPPWLPLLRMNPLVLTLLVPALSLLLVFRTNSSYARFDEARKMWGLMLNRTRDLARQSISYMARGKFKNELPKRAQFLRHLAAFGIVYKHHFVREGDLAEELKRETSLTMEEVDAVVKAPHRPSYVIQLMSECLRRSSMDSIQRSAMDANLTTFHDDIGGSERLLRTPIPPSYTRLTARFLMVWHWLLPLGLWDALTWATVPATFVIASLLFCIDEVGVLIEEPFSMLPLNVIAERARSGISEALSQEHEIAARIDPDHISMPESPSSRRVDADSPEAKGLNGTSPWPRPDNNGPAGHLEPALAN